MFEVVCVRACVLFKLRNTSVCSFWCGGVYVGSKS